MNSNLFKKIGLVLLGVLVVIQFIKPARNEGNAKGENDISQVVEVPASVQTILETSCYDCHSNHSEYPWYTNVQPFGFWIQDHINDGKKHLNFSEFKTYTAKKQAHKLEEVAEEVEGHEMPLYSYTLIHKNAVLSDAQMEELIRWAKANQMMIKSGMQSAPAEAAPAEESQEGH